MNNEEEQAKPGLPDNFQPSLRRYNMYRYTSLGLSFMEALSHMYSSNELDPDDSVFSGELASDWVKEYDNVVAEELESNLCTDITASGKIKTYRNCEGMWNFILENVTLTTDNTSLVVDRVKVVAVEQRVDEEDLMEEGENDMCDEFSD